MHPVSKVYFGSAAGRIKVRYHNGSAVVDGYIVKQTASKKFVVTTNGTTKFKVVLAKDGTPAAGEMTINVYPVISGVQSSTPEQATNLLAFHVDTVQGNRYSWKLEPQTVNGYAQLAVNT